MKWIIVCTIALSVVFAAAIVGAKAIGNSFPARVAVLHLTDCQLPCWLNIEPGKTDFADADKRLTAAYANLPDYTLKIIFNSPLSAVLQTSQNSPGNISPIWISMGVDDPSSTQIKHIFLNFTGGSAAGQPRLADLLSLLGVPGKVIASHQSPPYLSQITLDYSYKYHLLVIMFPTQDRLLFSQPVNDMIWFADTSDMPPDNGTLQKWYGFTTLDRYYGSLG